MEVATIIKAQWWDNFNFELYINYLIAKHERSTSGI